MMKMKRALLALSAVVLFSGSVALGNTFAAIRYDDSSSAVESKALEKLPGSGNSGASKDRSRSSRRGRKRMHRSGSPRLRSRSKGFRDKVELFENKGKEDSVKKDSASYNKSEGVIRRSKLFENRGKEDSTKRSFETVKKSDKISKMVDAMKDESASKEAASKPYKKSDKISKMVDKLKGESASKEAASDEVVKLAAKSDSLFSPVSSSDEVIKLAAKSDSIDSPVKLSSRSDGITSGESDKIRKDNLSGIYDKFKVSEDELSTFKLGEENKVRDNEGNFDFWLTSEGYLVYRLDDGSVSYAGYNENEIDLKVTDEEGLEYGGIRLYDVLKKLCKDAPERFDVSLKAKPYKKSDAISKRAGDLLESSYKKYKLDKGDLHRYFLGENYGTSVQDVNCYFWFDPEGYLVYRSGNGPVKNVYYSSKTKEYKVIDEDGDKLTVDMDRVLQDLREGPKKADVSLGSNPLKKSNSILQRAKDLEQGFGIMKDLASSNFKVNSGDLDKYEIGKKVKSADYNDVEFWLNSDGCMVYKAKGGNEKLAGYDKENGDLMFLEEGLREGVDYYETVKVNEILNQLKKDSSAVASGSVDGAVKDELSEWIDSVLDGDVTINELYPESIKKTRTVTKKRLKDFKGTPEEAAAIKRATEEWERNNNDAADDGAFNEYTLEFVEEAFKMLIPNVDLKEVNSRSSLDVLDVLIDVFYNLDIGLISENDFISLSPASQKRFIKQAKKVRDFLFVEKDGKLECKYPNIVDKGTYRRYDNYVANQTELNVKKILNYFGPGGTFSVILNDYEDMMNSRQKFIDDAVAEAAENFAGNEDYEENEEFTEKVLNSRSLVLDRDSKIADLLVQRRRQNSNGKMYYYLAAFYPLTHKRNTEEAIIVPDVFGRNRYFYIDQSDAKIKYWNDSLKQLLPLEFGDWNYGLIKDSDGRKVAVNVISIAKGTRPYGEAKGAGKDGLYDAITSQLNSKTYLPYTTEVKKEDYSDVNVLDILNDFDKTGITGESTANSDSVTLPDDGNYQSEVSDDDQDSNEGSVMFGIDDDDDREE